MTLLGTTRYKIARGDIDEVHEVLNGEPWPYGVEPNRRTLEALMTYLVDQSLIAAPIPVDDLFVPAFG